MWTALILAIAAAACASTTATGESIPPASRQWSLHRNDARTLLQAPAPPVGDIPKECMEAGLNLQSSCSNEIQKATSFFGISNSASGLGTATAKVDQAKVDQFIADPSSNPSAGCCKAATVFNAGRCSCDKNVLELVKAFTNNDITLYARISQALAKTCNFNLLYDTTC